MRFMIIVSATPESEAGAMPAEADLAAMGKYHDELVKAGILLDAAGLRPTAKGARIHYKGDKRIVVDGPFTEAKELIAGYTIIEVKSKEEAVAWASRMPCPYGDDTSRYVELRQLFDLEDFGPSAAIDTYFRANDIGG